MLGSKGILPPLIPDCSALCAPAILKNIQNPPWSGYFFCSVRHIPIWDKIFFIFFFGSGSSCKLIHNALLLQTGTSPKDNPQKTAPPIPHNRKIQIEPVKTYKKQTAFLERHKHHRRHRSKTQTAICIWKELLSVFAFSLQQASDSSKFQGDRKSVV